MAGKKLAYVHICGKNKNIYIFSSNFNIKLLIEWLSRKISYLNQFTFA